MRRPVAALACLDAGATGATGATGAPDGLLTAAGIEIAARALSVPEAVSAVRRFQPDLLVADAILPGGDAESLLRQVFAMPLQRYPDAVILDPGLPAPMAERLRALGAAPVARPVTAEALGAALSGGDPGFLPPEHTARLQALLNALGVPPHPGREMLCRATALCWRDRSRLDNLRLRIYPEAGRPYGRSAAQAERAIRHVIEAAWRRGEIEAQHRIFGNTIDARRGRPTCGEMIAQLADILRWEG